MSQTPNFPKFVLVESPWKELPTRQAFAERCLLDCIMRGETPMAGHLLYTQVLDDDNPSERAKGINLHVNWIHLLKAVNGTLAVYTNHGISAGMDEAIKAARQLNIPIEYRNVGFGR